MATRLIRHLKEKSKEHSQLSLLVNQWEFDERLIPKALQNVAQLFPHYSRHDVSHSLQVLVNIERLLGEDLERLNATDTWLILESAFWHDIGMVVPADAISGDLASPEFRRFVAEIANNHGHELYEFCQTFDPLDASSCFSGAGTPLEAVEKFRLLIAEYYRGQHPDRSARAVVDPWVQAGISSPRNELLPKRLFSLLGQICQLHGKDFSSVLSDLEFRQVGLAGDNCHPRFVACLLRLGDLLDLEDNRFCPVMLRMVGTVPGSSQAHIDKHNSIKHFRLDRDRVEITANCKNAAAYEETERWFNWLRQEMQQQMAHWQDIVPERTFGLLPTLGDLRVDLDGEEQLLDFSAKERPRFDIDAEKTIELLRGSGLYEKPVQSLRELLQNAVDATLQRIWIEYGPSEGNAPLHPEFTPENWNNPYDKKIVSLLEQFAIEVSLEPLELNKSNNTQLWRLKIRDFGLGICKDDIKWMRIVGSSSRNLSKRERIERAPQWMRPSGAFGIGLQSAFLLTDSIHFETKSYITGEALDLTMNSPLGASKGLITIKKRDLPIGSPCGTTITLDHAFDKVPNRLSWSFNDNSEAYKSISKFDPIVHNELEYDPLKWVDEISDFSSYSPIPIRLMFKGKPYKIEENQYNPHFYDSETNIAIDTYTNIGYGSENVLFRGQIVEKYSPRSPFLNFVFHLWGDSAGSLLTVNRNDIKSDGVILLEEKTKIAVKNYLKQLSPSIPPTELDQRISAYIVFNELESEFPSFSNHWQEIILDQRGTKIKDLINLDRFSAIYADFSFENKQQTNNDESTIKTAIVSNHLDPILLLIAHYWQKSGHHIQITEIDQSSTTFIFQKSQFTPEDPFTDPALKGSLGYLIRGGSPFMRTLFPVFPDFRKLAIKKQTKLPYVKRIHRSEYFSGSMMLSPYCFIYEGHKINKISIDRLDELCQWIIENAEDKSLSIIEAKSIYNKLIEWIDNEVMKTDDMWQSLRAKAN